jgi:hypothetical protein
VHYICTNFDSNYLLRGVTLYRSLAATGFPFHLFVLAMDEAALATLRQLRLPNLEPIALAELERWAPELPALKASRSLIEYYFTLSPYLPLYLFERRPDLSLVTYLDADLYFYRSPQPLFEALGSRSLLAIEHRYPAHLEAKRAYGRFNVQFLSFRRDEAGLACLRRWREQCREWCYDRLEGDRYGDQKYLDEWPQLYRERLVVPDHPGAGLAPWNWSSAPIRWIDGEPRPGGQPLIFYHFHGLKVFRPWFISTGLLDWGLMPRRLARWLYAGYVRELRRTRDFVAQRAGARIELRDRRRRGKGVSVATLGEVLRKSFTQAMLVP